MNPNFILLFFSLSQAQTYIFHYAFPLTQTMLLSAVDYLVDNFVPAEALSKVKQKMLNKLDYDVGVVVWINFD